MPKENVEIVLEAYARFNTGDTEPPTEYWHEDAEYVVSRDDPDAQTHRGLEAVRRQVASWVDAYPDLRVEPLEAKENRDKVFLWVRFVGHGAASGLPIDMELAHVCTIRDGKTLRVEEYNDRAEALEAVGLAD
jgi:ketosteroid isomerase-like protein